MNGWEAIVAVAAMVCISVLVSCYLNDLEQTKRARFKMEERLAEIAQSQKLDAAQTPD